MIDVKHMNIDDLQSIRVSSIRTNKRVNDVNIKYLNIESAFDIETTSVMVQEQKAAFMYIWMFGIGYGENVYYGRTWEEFIELCETLQKVYNLSESRRLIVYVHNLGFEFQFMRKYFTWEDVFAVGERKPIKALCSFGIEFRDSYILSGYSLQKTAENLTTHKVEKMVGDLDYSKIRTYNTTLDEKEMKYCNNDIVVVNAYINEQIQQYGDITKIPLTNTGRVRNYVRNNCYYTSTNHRKSGKGKYVRYRKIMNDLTLNKDEYVMLKRAFMGGFTHANANYSGKLLENVSSIDFTSSYPSVMLAEQYPMSKGKKIVVKSVEQLELYCKQYCLVFDIKLSNVKPKIHYENYISESKCFTLKGAEINNGRVYSADELAMTITNVDYDIMKQCYSWDNISVKNVIRYHKGYLPKDIIKSILNLYQNKTVLKGVEGKEVEYLLSKGMLNSVYGMCVTDVINETYTYTTEWGKEPPDVEGQIEKYNDSKNRFLYYPWGVFVTAYARKNLWTGIIAMGKDYVYSDTDSIKYLNYEKHIDYVKWYNEMTRAKLETMCEYYKLDKNLLSPKTQKGKVKLIGMWDYEGTYSRFKTLGAKRYLIQEGDKLHLTVAGLSKQNGIKYMIEQCNGDYEKVFKMFNDELYIPKEKTGKMTHTYIDDCMEFTIKDYQGNDSIIRAASGIHLENCEFTLSISKQYGEFIKNFTQGYLYKGVKYE